MHEKTLVEAKKRLLRGELVIFPTETVYGIGSNAENEDAVKLIYQVKKRPFHISTEQKNTGGIIYTSIALSVLVVGLAWIPIQDFIQNRDSNSYSFLYQEHI